MPPSSELTGACRAVDGTSIFFRAWTPAAEPDAILLFVHGLAEHSGRYAETARYFVDRGKACYALDLRGHGRSDGLAGHVDSFADYDRDCDAMFYELARRHPESTPLALIGHSMGGLIAIRATLRHADRLAGTVLSSPALAAHPSTKPPALLQVISKLAARIAPRLRFATGLDPIHISRDPDVVAAYVADPLISNRASARWYTSFLQAQSEAFTHAKDLTTPTLVMQSAADFLVDPASSESWAEQAAARYHLWPDLYHEMLNEPEKEAVLRLVESWLDIHW